MAKLRSLRRPFTQKGDFVYSSLSIDRAPFSRAIGIVCARFVLAVVLCFLLNGSAIADGLAKQFLDGLRERNWHEVALEYLDRAEDDPLADADFLDRVDYERAITLSEMARKSLRESERSRYYVQAIELLDRYAEAHSDALLYFDAKSSAAKMLADQARGKLSAAQRLPEDAERQRKPLLAEAREKFDASATMLEQLLDTCREKLESLPKGALTHQDPETPAIRQKVLMVEAEARFLAANLLFEKAETYSETSMKYEETLESAARAFVELSEDYKEKLVGFFGKLYEGRCYQALERWKEALGCFEELVEEPISQPEFRRLKARAYRYRAECLVAQGDLEQAIEECNDCLRDAKGSELKQPEWLAVAFRLAEALQQQADQATGSEASRLESEVRQLMREVANQPGEFQAAAKAALAAGNTIAANDLSDLNGFAEAYAAGKDALERMNSSKLAARLASNNNPEAAPEFQRQAEENMADAQKLFRRAIQLADSRTNVEDLLSAQYYLCWLYWEEELYYETAVLGGFIAQRYPESNYAASAAKVALAAYEKLYQQARGSGSDSYEAEQLAAMAEYMSRRWPDSAEAGAAVNLLMQIALRDNRIDDARRLMQRLPEENRASAQLTLGSAVWTMYLRQTRSGSATANDATAKLRSEAKKLLSHGFDGLKEQGSPNYQDASAVLYYVQLLLAQGDAEEALRVLENSKVSPLAVVEGQLLQLPETFVHEAYKAALRCYISVNPPQRKQAQRMMNALEETVGDGPQAAQQLTRVYLSIGLQLQRQIKELTSLGKRQEAERVASAFEDLLERITDRGDAKDWKVRSWVAQTNLQLGEGLSGEAAERYLEDACEVFQAMLDEAAEDPGYAPSPLAILAVRKQLGDCHSAQQNYTAAMQQYEDILREKPNMLDLQLAIAEMLQHWGRTEELTDKLDRSIKGALPQANRKNLAWGWLRLASVASQAKQRAADNPAQAAKYEDLFFQARYNVALSRLYAAQISSGAKKTEYLKAARKNVESMKRLYPQLGGPNWKQQFDDLLKEIEAEEQV